MPPGRSVSIPTIDELQRVLEYHERTKHRLSRYAESLGYLDWNTQPIPFRFYEGAPVVGLPFIVEDSAALYPALYEPRTPSTFDLRNVGALLELSMGLSAWKSAPGSSWALRMNPSSGNLHPTEAYVIAPSLGRHRSAVYHYSPYLHALERRTVLPDEVWSAVESHYGGRGLLMSLASVFWREAWKYGERAFRYCQLDIGHALAALGYSAALLGWTVRLVDAVSESSLGTVLGFDRVRWVRDEEERAECVCWVSPGSGTGLPQGLPRPLLDHCRLAEFEGNPNTLSSDHVHWRVIDDVARATAAAGAARSFAISAEPDFDSARWSRSAATHLGAAEVIRKRRSGVRFDGRTTITRDQLLAILDRTLPRNATPFDLAIIGPCAHLLLFVHRVEDLEPGLYFFAREESDVDPIRAASRREFLWRMVEPRFPLYALHQSPVEDLAALVCCHQPIAGEGAFSLGVVSRFRPVLSQDLHAYRRLYWEAGAIGQVLYLEAEARGARGTGIGCFFDDETHRVLGLRGDAYQSLYHFTIGGPVEDLRLRTRPPYDHLESAPQEQRIDRSV